MVRWQPDSVGEVPEALSFLNINLSSLICKMAAAIIMTIHGGRAYEMLGTGAGTS